MQDSEKLVDNIEQAGLIISTVSRSIDFLSTAWEAIQRENERESEIRIAFLLSNALDDAERLLDVCYNLANGKRSLTEESK